MMFIHRNCFHFSHVAFTSSRNVYLSRCLFVLEPFILCASLYVRKCHMCGMPKSISEERDGKWFSALENREFYPFSRVSASYVKDKLSSFYSRYAQPKYAREHAVWLITETGYGSIWAEVVLRWEFFGKWDFQTKAKRYLSTITVKRWRFNENTHARRCWARFEWNWYLYCGTEKTLQRNRVLCALDWFEAFEQFCRFLQIDFSFLLSIDSL